MIVVKGTPSGEMLKIFSEDERTIKMYRIHDFGMLGLARNDILFFQAISENVCKYILIKNRKYLCNSKFYKVFNVGNPLAIDNVFS